MWTTILSLVGSFILSVIAYFLLRKWINDFIDGLLGPLKDIGGAVSSVGDVGNTVGDVGGGVGI